MRVADKLHIEHFHDKDSSTLSYLVLDRDSGQCAIIDSVQGFDPRTGRSSLAQADAIAARVGVLGATVQWILETHVHADHLSAAPYLRDRFGGRIGIGAGIAEVQVLLGGLLNLEEMRTPGSGHFDFLFLDGEQFALGGLSVQALHTPGHTPACVTYVVRSASGEQEQERIAAFVGDTLFMPDYGTARCDFPGGDARKLYASIKRVLALPDHTELFMCHDYQPGGRDLRWMTTVEQERCCNIHVRDGIDEASFVAMREARDATLALPALMLPSVQVNLRAGHWPAPEQNGICYLKIPVNAL